MPSVRRYPSRAWKNWLDERSSAPFPGFSFNMRPGSEVRTLLLHNPTAGAAHPRADELLNQLTAAGFSPSYQSSKDETYREALEEEWDLVIVAGGDGTVARAARALGDRKIPIAILPIGTANNIARALGLSGDIEFLIPHLRTARSRQLDVGVAEGPWGKRKFFEAVGFGAIAKAIAHSGPKPPKPLRIDSGREDLQKFVREAEAERFEIAVDGERFAGDFLLLEILNFHLTGPALPISLSAAPDDGVLDVVFLFEKDRGRMLEWLKEPETRLPPVTVLKGRKIGLRWERGHVRIDSRIYLPPESASPVKIQLESDGLRVLVPDLVVPRI
jgi:diacylglycerol kinase (ATP)